MTQLFVRVYLSLGLVLALCLALVVIAGQPPREMSTSSRLRLAGETPRWVAEAFQNATTPEARARAEQAIAERVDGPVKTVPIAQVRDALDGHDAELLDRGEPVVGHLDPLAPPSILIPVPNQPWVVIAPPKSAPPFLFGGRPSLFLTGMLALFGIAGVVAWTLRPLQRQLVALSDAARRFGAGELKVRSPVYGDDDAGKLAEAFNDMASRVQGLVHARQELLMAVSHELRTPVARLRFAIEMLADIDDSAQRAQRIERIHGDLIELDDLIGELLTYTSLDDGRRPLQAEAVDAANELALLVEDARHLKPDVHVALTLDSVGGAVLDRRLFRRAVSNLLSNAVRYGGGEVRLSAHTTDGWLEVAVDDDGPGVAEADRAAIFEPLVRLEKARSRHSGGVGLGLALALRIARAHRGTLVVTSSAMGGARFVLRVPTRPVGASPTEAHQV